MKMIMKKLMSLVMVSTMIANGAQAFQLNCMSDSSQMEVQYGQSGDKVKVTTMDGKEFSFLTKLSAQDFNTRCGIELNQFAGLYNYLPEKALGFVSIKKFGDFCSGQVVAQLQLELKDTVIQEQMICEFTL